jgi:hypothetical protein
MLSLFPSKHFKSYIYQPHNSQNKIIIPTFIILILFPCINKKSNISKPVRQENIFKGTEENRKKEIIDSVKHSFLNMQKNEEFTSKDCFSQIA